MAEARTVKEVLIESLFRDSDQITARQESIAEQLEALAETLPMRFATQSRNEIAPLIGEVKAAIAQASDNIEAGIVKGAVTALAEVNQAIDKLSEQANRYEAQSIEIETGLNLLASGFQKELKGMMQIELVSLSNSTAIVRDSFRRDIVDNQTRALEAIVAAKKNQTWGMVWQLGFALGIAVIGGVIASTIQLASVKDGIASIQTEIKHAKYPPMEGVTVEERAKRKTQ